MPPAKGSSRASTAGPGDDDAATAGTGAGTGDDTSADGADGDGAGAPEPQAAGPAPPAAAPVDAPIPRPRPAEPQPKTVEPFAAVREAPDHGHVAIIGHDGQPLAAEDLFDDPLPHSSTVRTKVRIYQKFRYPGTRGTVTTQLVYAAGVPVPREHAARLAATVASGTADPEPVIVADT